MFIVKDKAIQNCINLKITSLYISTNTFQAMTLAALLFDIHMPNYSMYIIHDLSIISPRIDFSVCNYFRIIPEQQVCNSRTIPEHGIGNEGFVPDHQTFIHNYE